MPNCDSSAADKCRDIHLGAERIRELILERQVIYKLNLDTFSSLELVNKMADSGEKAVGTILMADHYIMSMPPIPSSVILAW